MIVISRVTMSMIVALGSIATGHAAEMMRFTGTATSDGSEIYREHHELEGSCKEGLWHPQAHTVTYEWIGGDRNSETFARKQMEYERSVLRPTVDFRQSHFNEVIEITRPSEETIAIRWQTPEGDTETSEVPADESVVVDSGFNHLVRKHWQELGQGESFTFSFLSPTRGELYEFILEPAETDEVNADRVVRIRPAGFLVGFLVDPIVLGYDESGFLTDYRGLTNIRKSQDDNYDAHIRYTLEQRPGCPLVP